MNYAFFFALLTLIYLALAPRFAPWLYRQMLFFPEPLAYEQTVPQIDGIQGQSVSFIQADGNRLNAWYYQYPAAKFTMLVSHGNHGNILTHDYLVKALLKLGVSVFTYDYSGYGASTGLPDLAGVTHDIEAAYDYLVNKEHVQPDNLILYGESLGGAISAHLAAIAKVRAIIYQSGFSSLRKIAIEKLPFLAIYPEILYPSPPLNAIKNFQSIHVPVLIIHGLKDAVVPYHHAEAVFRAAHEPKELVCFPLAAHKDFVWAEVDRYQVVIKKFLQSLNSKAEIKTPG